MGAIASHLWQSTLVAAVVALLAWFLRNNAASARYWIWFAASVKFLVPFAVFAAAARVLPWPGSGFDDGIVAAANGLFNPPGLPSMSGTSSGGVLLIWAAGTIVVALRWLREWRRMAAVARAAEPIVEGPVFDALRRLEPAVGMSTPTAIVCSPHRLEPGVVGFRKPVLVWPRHLSAALREDHVEPILAHELAHVARRDNLLASLHMLTCAVFWFNPVVWWIGACLIEERERACDERVLALGHDPAIYAGGILKTCELCLTSSLANVSGVTGGDLKKRIGRIIENRAGAPLDFARRAAVAAAAFTLVVLPITAGAGARQSGEESRMARSVQSELDTAIEGQVTMECAVRTDEKPSDFRMECVVRTGGTPSDIRIVRSFDPAHPQVVPEPVRPAEVRPGRRREQPVPVMMTVGIAFNLQ